MNLKPIFAAACLTLPLHAAFADESVVTKPVASPAKVQKLSLQPSDQEYPAALHSTGVQGTVEVLAVIGADGFPSEASVASTSRSTALDEAALKFVRDLKFGSRDPNDKRPLPNVLVPVEFLRDSVSTLPKKTCQEFNTDLAYFSTTFPEKQVKDMPVVSMTIGVLVLSASQKIDANAIMSMSRKAVAARDGIASACAAAPDASYFKLFRDLAEKSGG